MFFKRHEEDVLEKFSTYRARIYSIGGTPPTNAAVVTSYRAGYNNMATVTIYYDKTDHRYIYFIQEPPVNEEIERLYMHVKEQLQTMQVTALPRTIAERERLTESRILQALRNIGREDAYTRYPALRYYLIRDTVGWWILDVVMRDPWVEEIDYSNVDHYLSVMVKHGNVKAWWIDTNVKLSEDTLTRLILYVAGKCQKSISESRPLLEARTPEGYRVAANLKEVGRSPGITIRKFPEKPLSITRLVAYGTMSSLLAAYLWTLVENMKFVIVIGAMGSGKTTVLQSLTSVIPWDVKIVTIEDTPELRLQHPRWQALYTRPAMGTEEEIDMFKLARYSLRSRAQYIIIGEVRDKEMYVLAQMAASGHGSMTTFHAENPVNLIVRMITPPLNVQESFLVTIAAIVLQRQVVLPTGDKIRVTSNVWEITGLAPSGSKIPVTYKEVFRWEYRGGRGTHVPETIEELLGKSHWLRVIGETKYGVHWKKLMAFELREKQRFLERLVKNEVFDYKQVTEEIYKFNIMFRKALGKVMDEVYKRSRPGKS